MHNTILFLALLLTCCYGLSFLAREYWLFDLLAQFKVQYFAGAIILLFPLLYFHSFSLAALMLVIALAAYIQVRTPMDDPWQFKAQRGTSDLHIVQYNKFYKNRPHSRLKEWVSTHGKDIDVLVMQEVENRDIPLLKEALNETFPFNSSETDRPDWVMIFSKHPLENLEIKKICANICGTRGIRFEIEPKGPGSRITIFSVHTKVPIGKRGHSENKAELEGMGRWISQDQSSRIIFLGDWNATPYATAFQNMKSISGLHYQNYGYLPETSWPYYGFLPFFKIPIDHILFKGDLTLLNLKKGPSFLSDHHSLHGFFKINRSTEKE